MMSAYNIADLAFGNARTTYDEGDAIDTSSVE
jgi:hypothetical protein